MSDNSSRKFKFISPGVFVNEIDNSQLPADAAEIGPIILGTAAKGPLNKAVTVSSFNDFVEVFGNPSAGAEGNDIWRNSSGYAPTYGSYAAQAWLRNNSPLTYMRIGGFQDPTTTDEAGYAGWRAGNIGGTAAQTAANGGGWQLVVWPSSSLASRATGGAQYVVSGAVAATFYLDAGRAILSGSRVDGATTGSACELYETDSNKEIKIGFSADGQDKNMQYATISLDPTSKNFFRNVLNTNPTIVNSTITTTSTRNSNQGGEYWVGESFSRRLALTGTFLKGNTDVETVSSMGLLASPNMSSGSAVTGFHLALLPMRNQVAASNETTGNDKRYAATRGTTGFFIGQQLNNSPSSYEAKAQQKLFRLEALSEGDEVQKEIKISITNIKAPQGAFQDYGTFSVLVRSMTDTDDVPVILERYDELDLNPASSNYIARVIGDQYEKFDTTTLTNRQYGTFPNRSRYVRVVMDEDVERGSVEPNLLPFGVYGPLKYKDVSYVSGSGRAGPVAPAGLAWSSIAGGLAFTSGNVGDIVASMIAGGPIGIFSAPGGYPANVNDEPMVLSLGKVKGKAHTAGQGFAFSGTISQPSVPLRTSNKWGTPKNLKSCYWGAWTGRGPTDTTYDPSITDYLTARARGLQTNPGATSYDIANNQTTTNIGSPVETSWVFSLDDISGSLISGEYYYVSGSRTNGRSYRGANSYTTLLDAGLNQFTTVLAGGATGYNVTERDPFRNSSITDSSTDANSSPLYSLKRAIDTVSDADQLQYNVITMPGVTQKLVTNHLLDMVEDRADALAIVDLPKVYTADTENSASAADRNNFTVAQAVNDLKDRNINNSYGAAYYPWVLIQDTVNNRTLWAPPSVAAMGALSTTDRIAAPWFAPAGFTRGGLSEGAAGIPVLEVSRRLTSDDRDDLYEANINPIAKFPAEGIVIFGQKTLQQTASALDRINVRRLLIFLKREISFIASRLVFAPNTRDTWTRFKQQATPVLDSVRSQFGIDDFRLILDESTTTPDLIDRNIIYAKLIVKPTRAAEYFAIDFVVTNSGAAFDD